MVAALFQSCPLLLPLQPDPLVTAGPAPRQPHAVPPGQTALRGTCHPSKTLTRLFAAHPNWSSRGKSTSGRRALASPSRDGLYPSCPAGRQLRGGRMVQAEHEVGCGAVCWRTAQSSGCWDWGSVQSPASLRDGRSACTALPGLCPKSAFSSCTQFIRGNFAVSTTGLWMNWKPQRVRHIPLNFSQEWIWPKISENW